jgi:hypothetical protein
MIDHPHQGVRMRIGNKAFHLLVIAVVVSKKN